MTAVYHDDLIQGSDEWHQARCGLLTASEVKLILTPTLKIANNDKTRAHVWEIAAQRINNYVEPSYIGDDMLRGHEDEVRARIAYQEKYGGVIECGFVTNDTHGPKIGYSPDWLVDDDGQVEAKSRRQKYQVQTILNGVPDEHWLQLQTGLVVTERKWMEYISYCGGMPMVILPVEPHAETQQAIIAASQGFEKQVNDAVEEYKFMISSGRIKWIPTDRVIEQEMFS